eukprot:30824-Pelagococcus_subviridis.AAC.5
MDASSGSAVTREGREGFESIARGGDDARGETSAGVSRARTSMSPSNQNAKTSSAVLTSADMTPRRGCRLRGAPPNSEINSHRTRRKNISV